MHERIQVGFQAFAADGGEEFGAVRAVDRDAVVVWIENSGDVSLPITAVKDVHAQKVIFDCRELEPRIREAIGHAHDGEVPGL